LSSQASLNNKENKEKWSFEERGKSGRDWN